MAAAPLHIRKRVRTTLVALCTAGVAALTVVPVATSHAEPKRDIDDVQRQVSQLRHEAEQASERYNEVREQRKGVARRLDSLQSRVDDQQAEMSSMQSKVGNMAAATYRNGGFGSEMQLILSDDPREFLQQATALQQFSRQQTSALRDYVQAREQLAADQRLLVAQQAEIAKLRKKLATEKSNVEGKLGKAEGLLNSLEEEQQEKLEAARQARLARASRAAARQDLGSISASGSAGVAVDYAYDQMGEPYAWGAAGPDAWDCSGLTMMAWDAAGVSLPHSSSMQYEEGTKVSQSELQPGDLVFFYDPISHVGIYIGDGKMVHAPNESDPVKVDPISYMPYTGATRP